MEEFEEFKAQLKEKWLNYYQVNLSCLEKNKLQILQCEFPVNNVNTGAKEYQIRPIDSIILSIIISFDQKTKDYIQFLSMATNDTYRIVELLGLNFDPKIELEKRKEERAKNQLIEPPSPLDEFRNKNF
ncbi:DUF5331 domain-containing protein [Geminocystis herdmanii]|uniref:DUF5331 domain-containing protein n=1 Tax=Geminocystis herdmanii TaxID=669359 RepID=UPI0011817AA8|nr:DUF5331 domain-containing protein [Geminocystis herdmanii]